MLETKRLKANLYVGTAGIEYDFSENRRWVTVTKGKHGQRQSRHPYIYNAPCFSASWCAWCSTVSGSGIALEKTTRPMTRGNAIAREQVLQEWFIRFVTHVERKAPAACMSCSERRRKDGCDIGWRWVVEGEVTHKSSMIQISNAIDEAWYEGSGWLEDVMEQSWLLHIAPWCTYPENLLVSRRYTQ